MEASRAVIDACSPRPRRSPLESFCELTRHTQTNEPNHIITIKIKECFDTSSGNAR